MYNIYIYEMLIPSVQSADAPDALDPIGLSVMQQPLCDKQPWGNVRTSLTPDPQTSELTAAGAVLPATQGWGGYPRDPRTNSELQY